MEYNRGKVMKEKEENTETAAKENGNNDLKLLYSCNNCQHKCYCGAQSNQWCPNWK